MTKSINAKEVQRVVRGKPHVFKEVTISLYCTNRTSLENLFYATRASIYTKVTEATRSLWNVTEDDGST